MIETGTIRARRHNRAKTGQTATVEPAGLKRGEICATVQAVRQCDPNWQLKAATARARAPKRREYYAQLRAAGINP